MELCNTWVQIVHFILRQFLKMFDIAVSSEITRSGPYFTDYNYDYKDLEANKIIKKIVPQQIIPERTVVTLEECKHDFKV